MAQGTVTFTAPISADMEVFGADNPKIIRVTQSGSFPSTPYNITSATVKYTVRLVYGTHRTLNVSRVDNGSATSLGSGFAGSGGNHQESLNTGMDYEGLSQIQLDGGAQWSCKLRGGTYFVITVAWEDAEPEETEQEEEESQIEQPITGKSESQRNYAYARRTEISVILDGVEITEEIGKNLLSFSYTDNEEDEADDLQIKLQDVDGKWLKGWLDDTLQAAASGTDVSTKGLKIGASIRLYEPDGQMKQLNCGEFELDSIKASGPPSTVTIKGTSLPYGNGIRTEDRDKAWEKYTLSRIGAEIASNAGLGFIYDCPEDPTYNRVEQAKQTDIAFLQELCHRNAYSLKVSDGKLVIFDQKRYESLASIAQIGWMDGTYTKYDLSTQEGDTIYAACRVRYYHPGDNVTYEGIAYAEDYDESKEDNLMLAVSSMKVTSNEEAKALAAKLLHMHNRYEKTGSFTLLGNPLLSAGLGVTLSGFGSFDEKFIMSQCKHDVSSSGYTTKLKLRAIPDQEVIRMKDLKEEKKGGGGKDKPKNDDKDKVWKTLTAVTVYKDATGNQRIGFIAKGVQITILGSTAGSRTLIKGGNVTGYVPTGSIGKV